jgi:putative SOS response-associated peptidase YedK
MCGRFTQNYTWQQVHEFLRVFDAPQNLRARYNIAPTTLIDMVRRDAEGRRELVRGVRWGLIPNWWKKPLKDLPAAFNARVESVADKPTFREAFKKRRCIIPATGFLEWTGPRSDRQPNLFTAEDGSPLIAFAGLWDRWRDPATGEHVLSCTILVGDASTWMTSYHGRMPVLLTPKHFDAWLDGSIGVEDLRLAAKQTLRGWPVSQRLNRSGGGDDDPSVLEAIDVASSVASL